MLFYWGWIVKILIDVTPEELVTLAKNALQGDGAHLDADEVINHLTSSLQNISDNTMKDIIHDFFGGGKAWQVKKKSNSFSSCWMEWL